MSKDKDSEDTRLLDGSISDQRHRLRKFSQQRIPDNKHDEREGMKPLEDVDIIPEDHKMLHQKGGTGLGIDVSSGTSSTFFLKGATHNNNGGGLSSSAEGFGGMAGLDMADYDPTGAGLAALLYEDDKMEVSDGSSETSGSEIDSVFSGEGDENLQPGEVVQAELSQMIQQNDAYRHQMYDYAGLTGNLHLGAPQDEAYYDEAEAFGAPQDGNVNPGDRDDIGLLQEDEVDDSGSDQEFEDDDDDEDADGGVEMDLDGDMLE